LTVEVDSRYTIRLRESTERYRDAGSFGRPMRLCTNAGRAVGMEIRFTETVRVVEAIIEIPVMQQPYHRLRATYSRHLENERITRGQHKDLAGYPG
jgi:hypothetical protein